MRVVRTCGAVTAGAVLVLGSWVDAQSVDEMIARHVSARGGLDRLQAIQTLKITRTVATGIGTTLRVVTYRKRPHFLRVEQGPAQPGAALIPRGINAENAWDTAPGGKIVTRPPQLFAEARDLEGDFDGLLIDWKLKGHAVTYDGKETLPGLGDTHKLTVTTKSGAVRTIYLDAATYLDRRHTGVLNLPNERTFDVVIDFANWQEVNGVKFAFDITEERTGKEPVQSLVSYTEKIEVNVPIDDALFTGNPQ